ncbi:uncharacterized protein LOC119739200 [Patiria miniata]|uniref:MARVEL domain-containing protein n=1 Tax=Patiria miniata TaxID=46514 RepID=A0A914B1U2_PATMI|nr:uncharacterized protein LOC119739200 [Patiria miniata]
MNYNVTHYTRCLICLQLLNLMCLIMAAVCVIWSGYPIFVCVMAMICTIFFCVLFLMHLDKRITVINWPFTELLNNITWTILHFISACVLAKGASDWAWILRGFYHSYYGCSAFAAVLGFILTILYGVSTLFSFRQFQAQGGLNRLRGHGGGQQGATAATITTTTTTATAQQDPPAYAEKGGMS